MIKSGESDFDRKFNVLMGNSHTYHRLEHNRPGIVLENDKDQSYGY